MESPSLRRYRRRWRIATWTLAAAVLASLGISVGVGWNANSPFERVRDVVIAVVASAFTFVALRWCAGAWRRYADRYLMTDAKAAALVEKALAKGLLPPSTNAPRRATARSPRPSASTASSASPKRKSKKTSRISSDEHGNSTNRPLRDLRMPLLTYKGAGAEAAEQYEQRYHGRCRR